MREKSAGQEGQGRLGSGRQGPSGRFGQQSQMLLEGEEGKD